LNVEDDMRRLLTHLAQFSSFSSQGEVLCTQGLAYLLEDTDARSAFASYISTAAGLHVTGDLKWRAEVRQQDGDRPDLEGCAPGNGAIVKVEAKIGAPLTEAQLTSYVSDLRSRCEGGLLMVLVPRRRATEVADVVRSAFGGDSVGPWRLREGIGCGIALLFWEDTIEALSAIRSERFHADLEQFEAMYRVLKGHDIEPVESEAELLDPEREEALVSLVERVTRRISPTDKVFPMGQERDSEPYRRRYTCLPLDGEQPCFSVGVRRPFVGHSSPIWLRFSRRTSKFAEIRDRLLSSEWSGRLVESGGHVWLPLHVPLNTDGEGMAESLTSQVQGIVRIAYQRPEGAS
jgi:hypothetical protein